MTQPRILVLDIETAPHLVYTWGLFKQNVSLDQIKEPGRILCWAAKWHGERGTMFGAEWQEGDFLQDLWDLLMEADAVVHYNGETFDMPWITGTLETLGYPRLPTLFQIDLLKTVRSFRLASGKLDWAAAVLLFKRKVDTGGFRLWRGVMDGDPRFQARMERYNRGDVVLTDKLLTRIKPHIRHILPAPLFNDDTDGCNRCGSKDLERRGFAYTRQSKYQRYYCRSCGGWSKGTRRIIGLTTTGI